MKLGCGIQQHKHTNTFIFSVINTCILLNRIRGHCILQIVCPSSNIIFKFRVVEKCKHASTSKVQNFQKYIPYWMYPFSWIDAVIYLVNNYVNVNLNTYSFSCGHLCLIFPSNFKYLADYIASYSWKSLNNYLVPFPM